MWQKAALQNNGTMVEVKAAQLMWRRETKELLLIVTTYKHKHEKNKENEILLRLPDRETEKGWRQVRGSTYMD